MGSFFVCFPPHLAGELVCLLVLAPNFLLMLKVVMIVSLQLIFCQSRISELGFIVVIVFFFEVEFVIFLWIVKVSVLTRGLGSAR